MVDGNVDAKGHPQGGRGLSRVPLLAGGAGDRRQALLSAGEPELASADDIARFPKIELFSIDEISAAGRRRRPRTSPTAACSTRSTSRATDHGNEPQRGSKVPAAERHAGLRAGARADPDLSEPDRADPAGGHVPRDGNARAGREFWRIAIDPRTLAALRLSFGAARSPPCSTWSWAPSWPGCWCATTFRASA